MGFADVFQKSETTTSSEEVQGSDPTAIDTALANAIQEPRSIDIDGMKATNHSLKDLIEASKYLQNQKAAKKPHRGLRFSKIVSGGSISR